MRYQHTVVIRLNHGIDTKGIIYPHWMNYWETEKNLNRITTSTYKILRKNIKRVLLPDTLGILTHFETYEFINEVRNKYQSVLKEHGDHKKLKVEASPMDSIRLS